MEVSAHDSDTEIEYVPDSCDNDYGTCGSYRLAMIILLLSEGEMFILEAKERSDTVSDFDCSSCIVDILEVYDDAIREFVDAHSR